MKEVSITMAVFIPVTPDPNRILLTDVSLYQGNIDFNQMRAKGVSGVIVRSGQKNYVDSRFLENWQEAKKAGLPRASYWFFDSREKPIIQMKIWASQLSGDFGEFGLWLDVEEDYGGQYHGWRFWYDCLEGLKGLVPAGTKIGLYSNYFYWTEHMSMATALQKNYFRQYDFWVASYGTTNPRIPSPFMGYKIHQFTDSLDGFLYGVDGSSGLDGNYFYGNWKEWVSYSGGFTNIETPIPTPITQTKEIILNLNNGNKQTFIRK
jgi:GH25 family lysozyme M1 (1,4-beta-N-acetylmuramidase)